jgi:hypothetical protein
MFKWFKSLIVIKEGIRELREILANRFQAIDRRMINLNHNVEDMMQDLKNRPSYPQVLLDNLHTIQTRLNNIEYKIDQLKTPDSPFDTIQSALNAQRDKDIEEYAKATEDYITITTNPKDIITL